MAFLCIGRSILKEAGVVSYLDLILAFFGVGFGLLSISSSNLFFSDWDIYSYRVDYVGGTIFSDTIISLSIILLLLVFILEIILFIVFRRAINQLNEKNLKLWYKTRFGFFILTVLMSIYRTIHMRGNPSDILLTKGIGQIIIILYKGYGLLVVTFLEELILTQEDVPNSKNSYFKL